MRICPDCAAVYAANERFCHTDGATLLDPSGDPLIGLPIGSYVLVRLLGSGGMGQVYLGVHPGIGSRVAIKVLDPGAAARKDLVDRFFAEAMAVNRIRHENIVNVLDLDNLVLPSGVTRPYIIMEHLEGRPLSSVLAHFGRLPQGTLTQLVREILSALAAAHSAGIIHRDLKPDNVFVSPQGRAKVLDFGIAKLLPHALGEGANFTQSGMLLGTPSYMAPEQARGQNITPATDLYAVGVILFEAATGRLPFKAEALYDLLNKHVSEAPPPPRSIEPSIHPAIEAVILRALAKDQRQRFQSAEEMSQALIAASAMLPLEAWASISLSGDEPALIANPTPRPTPSGDAYRVEPGAKTPRGEAPKSRRGAIAMVAIFGAVAAAAIAVIALGGGGSGAEADSKDETALAQADLAADGGSAAPSAALDAATIATTTLEASNKAPPTPAGPGKERTPPPTPTKAPDKAPAAEADKPATDKKEEEAKKPSGVIFISTADEAEKKGYKPFEQPAGVSTTKFDAVAFVPIAQGLARKLMSDAKLTEFDVSGVGPGGTADLHKGYSEASFWFRSESRSKADPSLPKGAQGEDLACMVYVDVDNGTVSVYAVTREKCNDSIRRPPRCSLAKVWEKAYAIGAPKGNWVAKMTYDKGWFFDITDGEGEGDDFTESLPDDC